MRKVKAAIVGCAMIIIAVAAIAAFGNRDLIYQWWLKPAQEYRLNTELFERMAPDFRYQAGADIVVLWELDLGSNRRVTRVFQTEAGRLRDLEGRKANIFMSNARENTYVAKLMANETFCGDLVTTSVIGVTVKNAGVTNLCRKPVTDPNGLLIGYITIGFKKPPSEEKKQDAIRSLDNVAPLIVVRAAGSQP